MVFAQRFLNTKCHRRDHKPLTHTKFRKVFIQQEITFKTLEIEKVREQLNKRKDDSRTVVSFFDWSHIANTFAESNIKPLFWRARKISATIDPFFLIILQRIKFYLSLCQIILSTVIP